MEKPPLPGQPGNNGGELKRTEIARSALITWLATPDSSRAKEIPTLDDFCRVFHVKLDECYGFMAEHGFMEAVVQDLTHWRRQTRDVIQAIKRNAEDASRSDQLTWVAAYCEVVQHPATEALRSLCAARK